MERQTNRILDNIRYFYIGSPVNPTDVFMSGTSNKPYSWIKSRYFLRGSPVNPLWLFLVGSRKPQFFIKSRDQDERFLKTPQVLFIFTTWSRLWVITEGYCWSKGLKNHMCIYFLYQMLFWEGIQSLGLTHAIGAKSEAYLRWWSSTHWELQPGFQIK